MFIWLQMPSFYAVIWHFSSRLALFAQAGLPDRSPTAKVGMPSRSPKGAGWCPHPELNWDQRFRKPLLYPFELWGQKHCKIRRFFAFRHRRIVNGVDKLQHLCNTSRMKATASRKTKQSESWPRRVSVGRESVTVYRRKTPLGNFSFMVANYADGKRRFDRSEEH